ISAERVNARLRRHLIEPNAREEPARRLDTLGSRSAALVRHDLRLKAGSLQLAFVRHGMHFVVRGERSTRANALSISLARFVISYPRFSRALARESSNFRRSQSRSGWPRPWAWTPTPTPGGRRTIYAARSPPAATNNS